MPGLLVSTLEHPFQSFLWGDYTAKTRHSYTYRVVAMRGKPKRLEQSEEVEVRIDTEDDGAGEPCGVLQPWRGRLAGLLAQVR